MDIAIILLWMLFAILSFVVGWQKNRGGLGFFLGVFLSLLGLIIIACLSALPDKDDPSLQLYPLGRGKAEIGRFSVVQINQMAGTRQLLPTDTFYDFTAKQWKPLKDLPGTLFPVTSEKEAEGVEPHRST